MLRAHVALLAGVKEGRTTTDLPVRQTYYWPSHEGKPVEQGPAMLLASYDDGNNIGFWDSFRDKRGRGWRKLARLVPAKEKFLGVRERSGRGDDMDPEWKAHHAPPCMVEEIQRQLAVGHGLSYTPEVQEAAYMDWGDDPHGGGWNSWNVGVKSAELREQITHPVSDAPVYICGEAYSDAQGWVEGALQTAEIVLGKFGILPLLPVPSKHSSAKT